MGIEVRKVGMAVLHPVWIAPESYRCADALGELKAQSSQLKASDA